MEASFKIRKITVDISLHSNQPNKVQLDEQQSSYLAENAPVSNNKYKPKQETKIFEEDDASTASLLFGEDNRSMTDIEEHETTVEKSTQTTIDQSKLLKLCEDTVFLTTLLNKAQEKLTKLLQEEGF